MGFSKQYAAAVSATNQAAWDTIEGSVVGREGHGSSRDLPAIAGVRALATDSSTTGTFRVGVSRSMQANSGTVFTAVATLSVPSTARQITFNGSTYYELDVSFEGSENFKVDLLGIEGGDDIIGALTDLTGSGEILVFVTPTRKL